MILTTKKLEEATLVTHGGVFHADEVFASVILGRALRRKDVKVFRTFKVPEGLSDDVIVYDIGFGEFDHHQKGGNGTRENGVPYAACGLVWRKYGPIICKETCNPEFVWETIDRELIQGIDALDNGAMPSADYPANPMKINNIISLFNPLWDSKEDSDEAFMVAVALAGTLFERVLASAVSKAHALGIVEGAIEASENHIMVLKEFAPWQECIFDSKNQKSADMLFVVFPSNRGGYNWQCVPTSLGGFGQRKSVPQAWRGATPEQLQELTGIKSFNFCHPSGFLGATETLEDAIACAKLAVEA